MISREVFLDETDTDTTEIEMLEEAEELSGRLRSSPDQERLAHSILENDEQTVSDGKLLSESVDYAMGSFTPDLMFEQIVKSYRNAQRLYGPTIIRELTGYDGGFIEKNLKITEFRERLRANIQRNIDRLKKDGLLDRDGQITEEGLQLASLVLYTEELDHLQAQGIGTRVTKEKSHYGERDEQTEFRRNRYKDLDVRGSIRRAVRRGHQALRKEDLKAMTRKQRGRISIVYAIDASGSMRGEKISISKKAGIALAYRAIQDENEVGLVVFTSRIDKVIPPTRDFGLLLSELARVRAGQETDLALAMDHATGLFDPGAHTKHLVLITDALPTRGGEPGKLTLEAVGRARDAGVTISIVGINLEREGEQLARKMMEIGEGKLYRVRDLGELDAIVLEDYEALKEL